MSKYIDADELFERINKIVAPLQDEQDYEAVMYNFGIADALEEIARTPTADVQEVKHGHWYCADNFYETGVCSQCKHDSGELHGICIKEYHYCPNCGASMVNEDE